MSNRLLRADFTDGLDSWVSVGENGPYSTSGGYLASTASGANGYGFARSARGATPTAQYIESVVWASNASSSDWIMIKLFADSAIYDQNGYGLAVRGSGQVFLYVAGASGITYQLPFDIASYDRRIKLALHIPAPDQVEAWVNDVCVLTSACTPSWSSTGLAEFAGYNTLTGYFDYVEIRDGFPSRHPTLSSSGGFSFTPFVT